jgi:hypothetical protein
VLVNGDRLQAADAELLEELLSADYLELVAVAVVRPGVHVYEGSASARALVNLYQWMDRASSGDAAEATRPLASCTANLAPEKILTEIAGEGLIAAEKLTAALISQNLDVLACLSGPFEGLHNYAVCATFGVWWAGPTPSQAKNAEFVHDLFATAAADTPLSDFLWASTAEQAQPLCLEFGLVPLVSGISVGRNVRPVKLLRRNLWLAALHTLSKQGWGAARARGARLQATAPQRSGQVLKPGDVAATKVGHALVHMGLRQLRHRIRQRDRMEQWRVGVRPTRDHGLAVCDTKGYRWLQAPPGHWYADPFLLSAGSTELLYMEDFDEDSRKGRIVGGVLDAHGRVSEVQPVLERPYHLAYPCVFEHDGDIFMIPETGFNNTVELYRATSIPLQWELVRVLYRGPAFDTSVLHHEGRFWFFTSLVEGEGRHTSKLLLFHSDRIDGDWIWHPSNPISHDARHARSGGGVFRLGSRLIRPAQDGSGTYGGAVHLREIQTLNETEYAEANFGSIIPARLPNAVGLHTYNSSARMEVIDCRLSLRYSRSNPVRSAGR